MSNSRKGRRPHAHGADHEFSRLAALFAAGRYKDAEVGAHELLARRPGNPLSNKLLGAALIAQERAAEALPPLREALVKLPADAELMTNLGIAMWKLGDLPAGRRHLERAVELSPRDPALHVNLARLIRHSGDLGGAAAQLHEVLRVDRDNGEALRELALISLDAGAVDAAKELFERVIALGARDDGVYFGYGAALKRLNRAPEAAQAFKQAYELARSSNSLAQLLHVELFGADWHELSQLESELVERLDRGFSSGVPLFSLLSIPRISSKHVLEVAKVEAKALFVGVEPLPKRLMGSLQDGRPLRIGYLSADFHGHATADLLAGVIESHDRERVRSYAYSHGPDDGTEMCRRIRGAFDVFVDVGELDLKQTAQRIFDDEIDILVDLKGWTQDARLGVLAYRPAPIQVSWLGFPGTLGDARLVDYIIGDRWVTPREHLDDFGEIVAQMPNCYQPNDDKRQIGPIPSRKEAGLPDAAFVYCSFNQFYKINPEVADLWARVLENVPASVLWLLDPGESARANLMREFGSRGVDSERIIFAPRLKGLDHLGRLTLADVALDTFPYGSHTTGSDALWAGVPLVTLPGTTFASRVGASLVSAAGIPELVCSDPDAFVDCAVELYRDRERLAQIKQWLKSGGRRSALFDTARFSRDLENLYLEIYRRNLVGDRSAIIQ
ncbi:tetratricopeptide repeat protein [Thauera sp. 2A1]|uniref:O-linked N-acetylglucosamine transferase, SPINDLY family protein n=1 Tax=Thauera sp. 2A1 TaxID=2570191 RepID=UPI0012911CB9|nr:tetratricopeptide repeat protein [Thauera sp. 2A1]KAI5916296.1 tetratricopeptide repeat protein [Thauera sp. 2A1]